jgi:protein SDA1
MELSSLQNLIKRDPETYETEFIYHWEHFVTTSGILGSSNPLVSFDFDSFKNLVSFLSHCIPLYLNKRNNLKAFGDILKNILLNNLETIDSTIRLSLLSSLSFFHSKSNDNSADLIEYYFKLLSTKDSSLLEMLETQILNYTRSKNKNSKNIVFNRSMHVYINKILSETPYNSTEDIKIISSILRILIPLFREFIWNDISALSLISSIMTKFPSSNIILQICDFLVSNPTNDEDSQDSDDERIDEKCKELKLKLRVSGKRKSYESKLNKISKKQKKQKNKTDPKDISFIAIEMLKNPQAIAQILYAFFKRGANAGQQVPFHSRLLVLNALTRIIGTHQLLFPDLYTFIHRFIRQKQAEITKILAYTAQSFHSQLPDDVTNDFISCISLNLVSDHCSAESIAIGINTIREICRRHPSAITSEKLLDLTQYSSSKKDKIVKAAARSLINLFREIDPQKLHKKYSSRPNNVQELSDSEEDPTNDDITFLSPEAVESHTKYHDYESRLSTVLKGRADRKPFGSKKKRTNKQFGMTNKDKAKNKPRILSKHNRKKFRKF